MLAEASDPLLTLQFLGLHQGGIDISLEPTEIVWNMGIEQEALLRYFDCPNRTAHLAYLLQKLFTLQDVARGFLANIIDEVTGKTGGHE